MYGPVARLRVKSGKLEALLELNRSFDASPPPGYLRTNIYQMDNDSDELYMSVVFESEDAYKSNAEDPELDKWYREMLELLDGEPEWYYGHIVYSTA